LSKNQLGSCQRSAGSLGVFQDEFISLLPEKKGDLCGSTENLSLTAKVKTRLIKDGDIESNNIDVKTLQCHVILLGFRILFATIR
jgi:hyperosmotically inducible protein